MSVHTRTSEEQKKVEALFRKSCAEDICSTSEASVPKTKHSSVVL
jgi:hypothetical protein